MPQITYRANTQSSLFPLLPSTSGQSVIVPERDQTFVPDLNPSSQNNPVDRGVPQILWGDNIMPSTYGYQSVGFTTRASGNGSLSLMDAVEIKRTGDGYTTYAAINAANGTVWMLNGSNVWQQASGTPTGLNASINKLSTATINGQTYLCVARRAIYRVTNRTTLTPVGTAGLNQGTVEGIIASMGYMIAWSTTGVSWSSSSDPLDFVPSDVTGAGGGNIQEAEGTLVWCQNTSYGFLIYTTKNVVQATWSGNIDFPWNFRGIPGSGGVLNKFQVSKEVNGQTYAYTSNGLQQIYHTGAKTILPFLTDYLSGRVFENVASGVFSRSVLSRPFNVFVSYIGDRYLVLSYGDSTATTQGNINDRGAIIMDTVQGRMGRTSLAHRLVFEIVDQSVGTPGPRDSIAFLLANGQISVMDFNLGNTARIGRLVLGRYQVARGYMSQLLQINVELLDPQSAFTITDWASLSGFNRSTQLTSGQGYLLESDDRNRVYNFSNWGKSHLIEIAGSFNITSLEMEFNVDGVR